jgi:hypothetical protein
MKRHNVRYWPKADMSLCTAYVRFQGESRHGLSRESAFAVVIRGKADIAFAAHMSAFDPKRTLSNLIPLIQVISSLPAMRLIGRTVPTFFGAQDARVIYVARQNELTREAIVDARFWPVVGRRSDDL